MHPYFLSITSYLCHAVSGMYPCISAPHDGGRPCLCIATVMMVCGHWPRWCLWGELLAGRGWQNSTQTCSAQHTASWMLRTAPWRRMCSKVYQDSTGIHTLSPGMPLAVGLRHSDFNLCKRSMHWLLRILKLIQWKNCTSSGSKFWILVARLRAPMKKHCLNNVPATSTSICGVLRCESQALSTWLWRCKRDLKSSLLHEYNYW